MKIDTIPNMVTLRVADNTGRTKHGELIRTDGIFFGAFAARPVIAWMTSSGTFPIGRAQRLWLDADVLYAEMEFADATVCPAAACAKWMVFTGRARAVSGEFASRAHRPDEMVVSELVSIRLCDVPCNPRSVVLTPTDHTIPTPSLKTWSLGTRLNLYDKEQLEQWITARPCELGPGLRRTRLGWAAEARRV